MTGNKKSLLTKLCTFSMCFFSLFSVGAATLAWFMANKTVTSREAVKTKVEDIHADFSVYKYSKNNTGTNLDESTTEDLSDLLSITNLTLNTYDTIFIAQNKYTPALIRIHLHGNDLPDVANGESQALRIKIARNTSFVDEEVEDISNKSSYKCITSVANFAAKEATNYSSFIQNGDLDDIADIDVFFENVVTSFKTGISNGTDIPTNFIDPETSTNKVDEIILNTSYSTVYNQNDEKHVIIYLYIDYNTNLIKNFTGNVNQTLNSNFLTAADTTLANDLTSITIETANN